MNKLEYYIIKYLQESLRISSNSEIPEIKYVEMSEELLAIIKGTGENELYISTECNLNNMKSDLITYRHIIDNLYKVEWSQVFTFLIGESQESEVDQAILTKELKLIQLSSQPLTNYLKSK